MIRNAHIKAWFEKNKHQEMYNVTKILGVEYAHIKLENEYDLYVTTYGISFIENLNPGNYWTDKKWFKANSHKLPGTSSVYKVRTKEVNEQSKELVIKWNRMGQEIPGAEYTEELMCAEFNSPFEEFNLVMELREEMHNKFTENIIIQKPLAIYVPVQKEEFWQTGRKKSIMDAKSKSHTEITLDMYRLYAVIYEWLKGVDAVQAYKMGMLDEKYLELLTFDSEYKLERNGFIVKDQKADHIILHPKKHNKFVRTRKDEYLYGLVDFELLARTKIYDESVKKEKRIDYLRRQRDRFDSNVRARFYPHLNHVKILGVDYIYGHVESTKGRLWVVGKDPYLFDYFLPERWKHTPRTKLSEYNEIYHTETKDNIHLVWKVSKVGLLPDKDPFKEQERKILEYGHNSPFEEFAIAMELNKKGIATAYPRAIYMTNHKSEISANLFDQKRYESHKEYFMPDGIPILQRGYDYIIIWGYWNGPDEKLAEKDGEYYEGINALRAYREKMLSQKQYISLIKDTKNRLRNVGIEDLNLRGSHLLISLTEARTLVTEKDGLPEIRICNFEFLKKQASK